MRAAWSCSAGLARTDEEESGKRRRRRGSGRLQGPVLWPARKWGRDLRGLRDLVHSASCLLHPQLTGALESSSCTQQSCSALSSQTPPGCGGVAPHLVHRVWQSFQLLVIHMGNGQRGLLELSVLSLPLF